MKKLAAAVFCILLLILAFTGIALADNGICYEYYSLDCHNNDVYWFDSCGNPHAVDQDCSEDEDCVDGYCQSKCGNGVCEPEWENCDNCWVDCGCSSAQRCEWGECRGFCGNGICDGDENCGNCDWDCTCPSDERCESGRCVTYCGNGKCDGNEDCKGCSWDCSCLPSQDCNPSHAKANREGCVNRCGNGVRDYGEDCSTCPEDVKCASGLHCFNGECVECIQDSHCESRDVFSGEFICSSDHKSTLEKGTRSQGVCENHQCSGEKVEITRSGSNCGNKFCQEGHCGCSEGYEACVPSGQCEKINELDDGASCKCNFQCTSNYCNKDEMCMKAINTPLSVLNDIIYVGEETKLIISADNALNIDIPTKLTLNLDSGASMSGVIGGDDCTGNQCTGVTIIPAKDRESIELTITGESAGTKTFSATVTAMVDGSEFARTETITLNIISPGDGICSEGENMQNACTDCGCPPNTKFAEQICQEDQSCKAKLKWWVYLIVGGCVFGGLIILLIMFLIYTQRIHYKKWFEKKQVKAEKEEADRKKIANALYKLSSQINLEKPWPVSKVIKKLRFKADAEIVHEEYNEMLERMGKTKKGELVAKKEASVKKEVSKDTKVEEMIKKVEKEGGIVKKAWLGAFLSLIFTGLGFIYVRAFGWFAIYFALFIIFASKRPQVLVFLWLMSIIHTYIYIRKKKYLKHYIKKKVEEKKDKK